MYFKAALCILLGSLVGLHVGVSYQPAQIAGIAKWGIGIFAFLWTVLLGFMAKVSDVTDVPGITYEEHRRLDLIVKHKLRRLWSLSRLNVFASVLCSIPISTLENGTAVSPWLCAAIGGLIGIGVFCVLLYETWLEELREFRSEMKEKERLSKSREELLKSMSEPENTIVEPKGQDLSGFGKVIKPD